MAMVLFVAACQNEQASYENTQPFTRKSFKETKALKGQVLNYADIFDPVKVILTPDGQSALMINRSSDHVLSFVDLNKTSTVVPRIRRGNGPDELIASNGIQFLKNGNLIAVNGAPVQKKVLIYKLDEFLSKNSEESPPPLEYLKVNEANQPLNPIVLPNRNIFDLNRILTKSESNRFIEFDSGGRILSKWGKYPTTLNPEEEPDEALNFDAYYAGLTFTEDHKAFIVSYYRTDLLEIYDYESRQLIKRLQGPDFFEPKIALQSMGEVVMGIPTNKNREGYKFPRASKDRFMVTFDGSLSIENNISHTELYLFGIDGTPLTRYTLDLPIYSFDVDWENNVLIGLTDKAEGSEIALVKYQF